jgi:hypothetical protein
MKFLLRKEFFACVTRYGGERYVRSFSSVQNFSQGLTQKGSLRTRQALGKGSDLLEKGISYLCSGRYGIFLLGNNKQLLFAFLPSGKAVVVNH